MKENSSNNSGVLIAGLALFSMFFGAGDLVWPIIVGSQTGSMNGYAIIGMLITGVSLPLLGLIAMLLFEGQYKAFFNCVGKYPSLILMFIIQAILGPVGSIPRLINLGHATLKPYFPFEISLLLFSIVASGFVLMCTYKKHKIVDLLGIVLTPILLASIGSILYVGLWDHPEATPSSLTAGQAFGSGIVAGYSTLDLIASFVFAPFVLSHFLSDGDDSYEHRIGSLKKMVKASLISAFLLSFMFLGLSFISSYFSPILGSQLPDEDKLSAIAIYLLGPMGGFIACLSIAMTCLTTTIPLVSIAGDYVHESLLSKRGNIVFAQMGVLAVSAAIANLGFSGIAALLNPFLQVLCPTLLVLSLYNIYKRIKEYREPNAVFELAD